MPLKQLKVTADPAKPEASDIAIVDIGGADVQEYNRSVVKIKALTEALSKLSGELKLDGLEEIYTRCVENSSAPVNSVKLRDDTGAVLRVTQLDRYSALNQKSADDVFTALGADINDYAVMTLAGSFDSSIFLAQAGSKAGEEGTFSKKIYEAYKLALDQTTARLIKDGLLLPETRSPLSTKPVATIKPTFHQERWTAFPEVDAQLKLFASIPNTVTLTPVVE